MNAVETALEGLPEADRAVVREAVRLADDALRHDPALLPSQLVARLAAHPSPAIRALVERMRAQAPLCPAMASLTAPGSPLRKQWKHHADFIGGLVFLPDGRLVSSSEDGRVCVWRLDADEPVRVLEHDMPVNWIAASPNGKRLAGACDDGNVYVYDTESWRRVRTVSGHENYVRQVAFTKGRLLSTSNDDTFRIWDRESGEEIKRFRFEQTTQAIAVSPGGRYALVCSVGNVMKIYDLNRAKCVKTLVDFSGNFLGDVGGFGFLNADNDSGIGHEDYAKAARWTPDGSRILSVQKELCTWDAKTGKQLSRIREWAWDWESLAITADGKHVLLAGRHIEIREIDSLTRRSASFASDSSLASGSLIDGGRVAALQGFESEAKSIALHPDGALFATGHEDGSIRLWDLGSAIAQGVPSGHSQHVYVTEISGDGRIGVTSASDGLVKVWDLASGAELRTFTGHQDPFVEVVRILPGGRVMSTDHAGKLHVWDIATGAVVATGARAEEKLYSFNAVALLNGGRQAICGQILEDLTLWDLEKGGEPVVFEGDARGIYGIHLTRDERRAFTVGYADDKRVGTLQIWDVPTRTLAGEIPVSSGRKGGYFHQMALLPDDRTAVTSDNDGRLEVWDLVEKKRLRLLDAPATPGAKSGWMHEVLLLPDGRVFTAKHEESEGVTHLRLWYPESGESRVVGKVPGSYRSIAVHAPSRRFAVGGKGLTLLDLETGLAIASFVGESEISKVAFTPDGRTLLAGELEGRVHVLRVQV